MRSNLLVLLAMSVVLLGCQSTTEHQHEGHSGHSKMNTPKTPADSLFKQVMDIHDQVMPKLGKIRGAQKRAQQVLDSLSTLSARHAKELTTYKQDVETLINSLDYADFAMDKWMIEFNMDSAKDNQELRVAYLRAELDKVSNVKKAILGSLSKVDSLLKE
ncbi:MAG: hypothetical protein FJY16_05870 [Bacteroidetes bacterium]|nr:hypothetical protein [Bacteroidota bacterium]